MSDYKPLSDDDLKDVHARALAEFSRTQAAQQDERRQCLQDRRFYSIAGAQWEDALGQQFENLPKPEINKIHLSVIRIINEYRNNRISVNFMPKDGSDSELAETLNGLYRADEQDSFAQEAYLNSFEEKVGGGFGAWRVMPGYEDEDDEDNEQQRIRFVPIFDADTCVFFDLDAKRQDKSDAKRCWVLTSITPESYEEEYHDSPSSWPKLNQKSVFDWTGPDFVWIAEYYEIEQVKRTFYILQGLVGPEDTLKLEQDEYEDRFEELKATGYNLLRTRKINVPKVHKYLMSGNSIIEDCGYIAGKLIPIVPDYGKRWFVDNIERCMGHVRLAKDAQRISNMVLSKLASISSTSSVSKPIVTPEMMAGHQNMWADDNIQNYPALYLNAVTDKEGNEVLPQLQYTQTAQIPPATAVLFQMLGQDLQEMLGNQQAGEVLNPNQSGIAVELVQARLDMQTFIYMDNHAIAMRRCGQIWLEQAKEIYVEEQRKMKTVSEHGDRGSVTLMQPAVDEVSHEQIFANDLQSADVDVIVDVGPSFNSRKEKTVRNLTNIYPIVAQTDPQQAAIIGSVIMMNMDGEGMQDLRDFNRKKLVSLGVVKPTELEQQEMQQQAQNQAPDPNAVYLEAAAKEAEAKAMQAQANTQKILAETQKTKQETAQILADMNSQDQKDTIDALKSIGIIKHS